MTDNLWKCPCDHCVRWRQAMLLMASASLANAKCDDMEARRLAAGMDEPDVVNIREGLEAISLEFALLGRAAETGLRGVLKRNGSKP